MKFRIVYTCFALSMGVFLFMGNSGGIGAVRGFDRTGGPLAQGFCGNSACHDDGSFNPTLEIEVLDGGMPVTNYLPGKTYMLSVSIIAGSGSPAEYGFQAVALDGANAAAGTFGTPEDGIQVTSLGGIDYAEQSSPRTTNNFQIEWTAPTTDVGEVTFYSGGNAANNANGSGGDSGVAGRLSLSPMVSGINSVELLPVAMEVVPNPVIDFAQIQLNSELSGDFILNVYSITGQLMTRKNVNLRTGDNTVEVDMNDFVKGIYTIQLTDNERVITKKIVKQ